MGLLLLLVLVFLVFGSVGHARGWGYYGWSPLGLLLVVAVVLLLAGVVHAEDLAPAAGTALLFGVVNPTPTPPPVVADDQSGPPGLPYAVSWWLGLAIMLGLGGVGYVIGNADSFELTRQQLALAGLGAVLLGGLGRVFPNIQHTMGFRQRELEHAGKGIFPRDLKKLAAGGEPAEPPRGAWR